MAKHVITFLLFCIFVPLYGQKDRSSLESERKKIINQIDLSTKLLDQTRSNKNAGLANYKTLLKKVNYREELIQNYQAEIALNETRISAIQDEINQLQIALGLKKQDLAKLLKNSYKNQLINNPIFFLFSASSLNDLFLRWTLLRKILQYKQKQLQSIADTQAAIELEEKDLRLNIQTKKLLLTKVAEEKENFQRESKEQKKLVDKLRKEEKSINRQIKSRRNKHEELNKEIEKLIRAEMERARKAERNNSKSTSKAISGAFNKRKGKLPWPVKAGIITTHFGIQPHATVSGVQEEKKGIGISTEKSTSVYAIADGVVSAYIFIPGKNYMVLVKHGEYFSVYSQVENISVSENQAIKAGEKIGTVAKDPETGEYELFFQIYKNKKRLNPEQWIKKRP